MNQAFQESVKLSIMKFTRQHDIVNDKTCSKGCMCYVI